MNGLQIIPKRPQQQRKWCALWPALWSLFSLRTVGFACLHITTTTTEKWVSFSSRSKRDKFLHHSKFLLTSSPFPWCWICCASLSHSEDNSVRRQGPVPVYETPNDDDEGTNCARRIPWTQIRERQRRNGHQQCNRSSSPIGTSCNQHAECPNRRYGKVSLVAALANRQISPPSPTSPSLHVIFHVCPILSSRIQGPF